MLGNRGSQGGTFWFLFSKPNPLKGRVPFTFKVGIGNLESNDAVFSFPKKTVPTRFDSSRDLVEGPIKWPLKKGLLVTSIWGIISGHFEEGKCR